jgi:hypothetical protein
MVKCFIKSSLDQYQEPIGSFQDVQKKKTDYENIYRRMKFFSDMEWKVTIFTSGQ